VYVDSGGWIALLSRRDRHHSEAAKLFREVARRRTALVTSNLVLAEVHRLLLFRAGIAAAFAAVERITALDRLSFEFVARTHHDAAMEWIRRFADQSVTYTDATSFAIMAARRDRQVIGFDRHFEIAGFECWRGA
jgi:predicted nucleic acid-binding protein